MGHKEPITIDTTIILITHNHGTVCCGTSASWNTVTSLATSTPLIWLLDATRAEISSRRCKVTEEEGLNCNTASSENVNMLSIIGSTMWVLERLSSFLGSVVTI